MLFLAVLCLLLFGLGTALFRRLRRPSTLLRAAYEMPKTDWPDMPVGDLSLFKREGLINQPMPKPTKQRAQRFQSLEATQDYIIDLVDTTGGTSPKIALQLSEQDGPDWTDVMMDGSVVALVHTAALKTARRAPSAMRH